MYCASLRAWNPLKKLLWSLSSLDLREWSSRGGQSCPTKTRAALVPLLRCDSITESETLISRITTRIQFVLSHFVYFISSMFSQRELSFSQRRNTLALQSSTEHDKRETFFFFFSLVSLETMHNMRNSSHGDGYQSALWPGDDDWFEMRSRTTSLAAVG